MSTMREIVGANVKRIRGDTRLKQDEFAQRLELLSGRSWSINAVSEAERGKRTWTADDIVLFARALRVSPADIVTIPPTVEFVEIDGGPVSRQSIQPDATVLTGDADAPLQAMTRVTRALDGHLKTIAALEGAVEQTYADAIGVRKAWLRQTGQQPQPREEDR